MKFCIWLISIQKWQWTLPVVRQASPQPTSVQTEHIQQIKTTKQQERLLSEEIIVMETSYAGSSAVRKDHFAIYIIIYRKCKSSFTATRVKILSHQIIRLKTIENCSLWLRCGCRNSFLKSEVVKGCLKSFFLYRHQTEIFMFTFFSEEFVTHTF